MRPVCATPLSGPSHPAVPCVRYARCFTRRNSEPPVFVTSHKSVGTLFAVAAAGQMVCPMVSSRARDWCCRWPMDRIYKYTNTHTERDRNSECVPKTPQRSFVSRAVVQPFCYRGSVCNFPPARKRWPKSSCQFMALGRQTMMLLLLMMMMFRWPCWWCWRADRSWPWVVERSDVLHHRHLHWVCKMEWKKKQANVVSSSFATIRCCPERRGIMWNYFYK